MKKLIVFCWACVGAVAPIAKYRTGTIASALFALVISVPIGLAQQLVDLSSNDKCVGSETAAAETISREGSAAKSTPANCGCAWRNGGRTETAATHHRGRAKAAASTNRCATEAASSKATAMEAAATATVEAAAAAKAAASRGDIRRKQADRRSCK
jgi:hypothetical protein